MKLPIFSRSKKVVVSIFLSIALVSCVYAGVNLSYDLLFWSVLEHDTIDPNGSIEAWPETRVTDIKIAQLAGDDKKIIISSKISEITSLGVFIPHADFHVRSARGGYLPEWGGPRPDLSNSMRADRFVLEEIYDLMPFNLFDQIHNEIYGIARDLNFSTINLIKYSGQGRFLSRYKPEGLLMTGFKGLATDYLDIDNNRDLVVFDDTHVNVFSQGGAMCSTEVDFHLEQDFLTSVAIGDITADGLKEVVAASSKGNLFIFRYDSRRESNEIVGRSGSALTPHLDYGLLANGDSDLIKKYFYNRHANLVIGDVNGDSRLDIVFANWGNLYVFGLLTGNKMFPAFGVVYDQILFLGNLDDDPAVEICWAVKNGLSNPLYIFKVVGSELRVAAEIHAGAGNYFERGLIGNLNENSKPELILVKAYENGENELLVYDNISGGQDIAFSLNPELLARNVGSPILADIDGDRDAELLYSEFEDQLVCLDFEGVYKEEWPMPGHDNGNTWCYPVNKMEVDEMGVDEIEGVSTDRFKGFIKNNEDPFISAGKDYTIMVKEISEKQKDAIYNNLGGSTVSDK